MAVDAINTDIERTWQELEAGIIDVYKEKTLSRERFMVLYTHVYNYCTKAHHVDTDGQRVNRLRRSSRQRRQQGQSSSAGVDDNVSAHGFIGHDLYTRIRDFLRNYLQDLTKNANGKKGDALLIFYATNWENFTFSSKVMNGFCAYLNRHWVRRESDEGKKDVSQIYELALETWKETLFRSLNEDVTKTLLQMIQREREGHTVNTSVLAQIASSYVDLGADPDDMQQRAQDGIMLGNNMDVEKDAEKLGTYRIRFEAMFLTETENFYTRESATFLASHSVNEYTKKVEERLKEENDRVEKYLHSSTLPRLMNACETVLIAKALDRLHTEFSPLLVAQKIEDLRRMYDLVSRLPNAFGNMRDLLEEHIAAEGVSAIRKNGDVAVSDPKQYVTTLLEVHKKYSSLIENALRNDTGFIASLDKACRKFINNNYVTQQAKTSQKSPEHLARYTDFILRKSGKALDDQEMEDAINEVMIIFKYIDDKDVFQKFYSKMLSNRLINQTSASDDAENVMLTKLKMACGFEYTTKLQRMYQDMQISRSMNEDYTRWLSKKEDGGHNSSWDFSMQVLTSGSWPLTQSPDFSLAQELEPHVSLFTIFYNEMHSGRKLTWMYNRSRGEITYNSANNKYILQVSTFQMGILLMYNTQDSYSIQEIMDTTLLTEDYVVQICQILMKARLLTCATEDEDSLVPSSVLSLNKDYKNKKIRVNLNVPLRTEQKVDTEKTNKEVEESRKIQIQCTIVRIAKAWKVMDHSNLIAEVCNQLASRFKASIPVIKKVIDDLLERGYLERSEASPNKYSYVA